jgi:hypothetical protein
MRPDVELGTWKRVSDEPRHPYVQALQRGVLRQTPILTKPAKPMRSPVFLFSAALGASIRFHATTRLRDIEQAELRQRHELARDLHDTIGHHMRPHGSCAAVDRLAARAK